ncbi:MAG TPA: c-type cytochrome biogenesis protein CcmI [Bauldia sp.]|nr:c-type cytochrome biogenesis protein CcmI [Bauldia sp.]
MTLWIVMAVLAAAVSLTVLVPLYRGRAGVRRAAEQEVSVYRDQLDEVERDLERGVIAPGEAEAARAEIARRLIRADGERGRAGGPAAGEAPRRMAAAAAVVGIPVLALGLYVTLGSPDLPDAPLAARLAAPPEAQDMAVLVARVEQHLAANPDDARGWQVLAPVYVRLGQMDKATTAFGHIARLVGSNAETEGDLGEAIVRANQGMVTADARAAFERAIKDDPKDVRARFYLALAEGQAGRTDEAAAAIRGLIAEAPAGATWVGGMRQMLAELEADATGVQPGPSAADMEAAGELAPEDRAAMIEGMVAQLAERLESDPGDAEGWARLVRSYMVLGRPADARAALEEARTALAGAADKIALVENEARATGLIQ